MCVLLHQSYFRDGLPNPAVDPAVIIQLIQALPERYSFDSRQRLKLTRAIPLPDERILAAEEALAELAQPANDVPASNM